MTARGQYESKRKTRPAANDESIYILELFVPIPTLTFE